MLTPHNAAEIALADHPSPRDAASMVLDALAAAGYVVVAKREYMEMIVELVRSAITAQQSLDRELVVTQ
jgi:hypothetical protein